MWKTVCFMGYLSVLSIFDIRARKLPVVWLAAGCVAAFVNMIFVCSVLTGHNALIEVFKCMAPGFLVLLIAGFSGRIGYGDGIVLLVSGGVLGSRKNMTIFLASMLLTALAAGVLLVMGKVGRKDQLPFVPFLTATVLLSAVL